MPGQKISARSVAVSRTLGGRGGFSFCLLGGVVLGGGCGSRWGSMFYIKDKGLVMGEKRRPAKRSRDCLVIAHSP